LALNYGIFDWVEHREGALSQVFDDRLAMLEAAEELGFCGYHVAEHQGTPLSLDTSPSLLLAAASQRTTRLRLGALVYCLPWYDPLRLYNEICMLDQLSKGRLEVGIGRGVSPIESKYYGVESGDQARAMFGEAVEVLMQGFRDGKLDYHGTYYNYTDVELYNRPYQTPYPPLWYPTSNIESIPYVASQGFHTSHNFATNEAAKPFVALYRETWAKHRGDADRLNAHVAEPLISNTRHVYVGESDASAVEEAREAFDVWSAHISYLSGRFSNRPRDSLTLESRMANGTALVGSSETVRRAVQEMVSETGINYFLGVFNFGNLPRVGVLESMKLFVTQVAPSIDA
jgi:alkanesulfonate monooxygenase SsuD/methylene tetrahydromethanopterin reductase-like flavin-dependent oxidoreductase (luciferase family)